MNGQDSSFFRRLNIRWPWLKLAFMVVVALYVVLYASGVILHKVSDPEDIEFLSPMKYHTEVPERVFAGKKLIALTFDDGPSDKSTSRLLDILKEKNVLATFFMLGSRAQNIPDIVKRAEEEGHVVGSHTMWHQNLTAISVNDMMVDISSARAVFEDILGHAPLLTRTPYGSTNRNVLGDLGTPMISWSVDTLDWQYKTTDSIINYVRAQSYDGGIILMHDIYETSVDAVPMIIDDLRKDGYEFVTVLEMAEIRGVTLKNGEIYWNFR